MLSDFLIRLRALFRRNVVEGELDDELRFHFERQIEKYIQSGLTREEATRRARLEFGGADQVKEECRDARGVRLLESFAQDVRYGFRMLRTSPGFTVVAVLTLALGIGANTAIFSAVNTVLLRPLPYRDSDQLVMIWQTALRRGLRSIPVTQPDFSDFRGQSSSFQQMAALYLNKEDYNVTGRGQPERVGGMNVSANLFSLLGVQPEIGRIFVDGEDQPGHERVVILSHRLWQRKFGGDANVLGQSVTIDSNSYTIVGVMPPEFQFPPPMSSGRLTVSAGRELWLPLVITNESRENHPLAVIGRMKSGATIESARSEIEIIASQLQRQYPKTNRDFGATVIPLREMVVHESRAMLFILLGAVSFVLLIACVNVANLVLARSVSRRREMAMRAALGAEPIRLIRQGLTENALVSLIGTGFGILLASWAVRYLRSAHGIDVPRITEIALDWHVLAFCAGVSVLTGLLFGLAPAWMASRADANECLNEGSRGSTLGWSSRLGKPLVIAEMALAIIPLVGAGLLIRSFNKLLAVNPGFNAQNILTANLRLSSDRYTNDDKVAAFASQLVERVQALPGVISAGTTNSLPITGFQASSFLFVMGRPQPRTIADTPLANERAVTPGYFSTMQIPLLLGRPFSNEDRKDLAKVVIVNEAVVQRFFGNANPIGQQIKVDSNSAESPTWLIVGVVEDIHQAGLTAAPEPEMYFPEAQRTWSTMSLVVRTATDPSKFSSAVQEQVWALDRDQPLFDIKTMEQVMEESLAARRFNLLLMGIFAVVALLLAAIGIYGVISYSVTQRRNEIGIRMALGAQRGDVLRVILGQGMLLALAGVMLGGIGAFMLTRVMSKLLFGVSATDPLTFVVTGAILLSVAMLACYIPARRAMRVDPMVALRYE